MHSALFDIINRSRLLNGWTMRTADELDPTIRVWADAFAPYRIPIDAYTGLYRRALDVRQAALRDGRQLPAMDATLLISQWTGPYGLKAKREQDRIDSGKLLPDTAKTQCKTCFGTSMREFFDDNGNSNGWGRCDHQERKRE